MSTKNRNRAEQRAARRLAKEQDMTYQQALRQLRTQTPPRDSRVGERSEESDSAGGTAGERSAIAHVQVAAAPNH